MTLAFIVSEDRTVGSDLGLLRASQVRTALLITHPPEKSHLNQEGCPKENAASRRWATWSHWVCITSLLSHARVSEFSRISLAAFASLPPALLSHNPALHPSHLGNPVSPRWTLPLVHHPASISIADHFAAFTQKPSFSGSPVPTRNAETPAWHSGLSQGSPAWFPVTLPLSLSPTLVPLLRPHPFQEAHSVGPLAWTHTDHRGAGETSSGQG